MSGARKELQGLSLGNGGNFTREPAVLNLKAGVMRYESNNSRIPSCRVEVTEALAVGPRGDRMVSVYREKDSVLLPVVRFFLSTQTNTIDRRFGLFVHRYQHEGTSRLVTYYQINYNGSADLQAAAYYKFVEGGEKRVWGIRRGSKQFDAKIQHRRIPSSIDAAATVQMYLAGECQDEHGAIVPLTAKKIHRQPVIPFSGE